MKLFLASQDLGNFAGSMVASHDLSLYQIDVKPEKEQPLHCIPDITKEVYGIAPYKQVVFGVAVARARAKLDKML